VDPRQSNDPGGIGLPLAHTIFGLPGPSGETAQCRMPFSRAPGEPWKLHQSWVQPSRSTDLPKGHGDPDEELDSLLRQSMTTFQALDAPIPWRTQGSQFPWRSDGQPGPAELPGKRWSVGPCTDNSRACSICREQVRRKGAARIATGVNGASAAPGRNRPD